MNEALITVKVSYGNELPAENCSAKNFGGFSSVGSDIKYLKTHNRRLGNWDFEGIGSKGVCRLF